MTQEELEKLEYCCTATEKSKSEIIRDSIDKLYKKLKKAEQK